MTLLILLKPDDMATAAAWRDMETGEEGGETALDVLAARLDGEGKTAVCLAVGGEAAITRSMRLPMKRRRDLERAANLILDDQLAAPLEDRVLAFGAADEAGDRLVCAMARETAETALATAREAGIDPDILTADHAVLPAAADDAIRRLLVDGRAAVRSASGAFTAERAFAEMVLPCEGREAQTDIGLADLDPVCAPNFRTGRMAKRRPLPDLRPYLVAASLLVAAGILFLAASFTEGLRYAGAAEELRSRAEARFAEAFPGTPVLDLERQIETRRAAGRHSDFLPLTAILAEVLEQQDTTLLARLTYSDEGELTAELVFSSFSDLEAVTTALAARGVVTEEGSDARREDGALVTRLFLRAA